MILNWEIMTQPSERTLIQLLNNCIFQNTYEIALNKGFLQYQLNPYNIMSLTPYKILQIFRSVQKKFSHQIQGHQIQYWYENELRLFVWVIICYAFISNKAIQQMDSHDWDKMSVIFHDKSPIALQFQALCLVRHKKSKKWSQEQVKMLENILSEKDEKNRWNQIAKQIFIRSNKRFFRTPKQCRQQWLNHLDPSKTKCEWNIIEDYQLLKSIIKNGKKWSKAAKQIGSHRTEHMVKNRYKSLINSQIKRAMNVQLQQKIALRIKHRLQNNASIKKYINGYMERNNSKQGKNSSKSSTNIVEQIFNQQAEVQKIIKTQFYDFESDLLCYQHPLFPQQNCLQPEDQEDLQKTKEKHLTLFPEQEVDQWNVREGIQMGQATNMNQLMLFSQKEENEQKKAPFFYF